MSIENLWFPSPSEMRFVSTTTLPMAVTKLIYRKGGHQIATYRQRLETGEQWCAALYGKFDGISNSERHFYPTLAEFAAFNP